MNAARWRAATTLTLWTALLVASMTWLVRQPSAPASGLSEVFDPAAVTMALLRALALGLGGYLLGVTALAFVGRLLHLPRAVTQAIEGLAPAAVRSLVRAVVGVTLTTAVVSGPGLASVASAAPFAAESEAIGEPVLMHRLPDDDEVTTPDAPTAAPVLPSGNATRVVRPGDSFWSIAESELVAARGGPVRDTEIDPHWRALVAANRDLTTDPDLLVPGQIVRLPSPR